MTSTRQGPTPRSALLSLGSYPTPLIRLPPLPESEHELWVKDDGQTATLYGGNKVRKLERLLEVARQRGARRLLTLGAAGSHHVLATCLFGRHVGLPTHAVLTAQPWTEHAAETLRAGLNAGLTAVPARSYVDALRQLRRERRRDDFVIAPGGSGLEGTWAYCLAVDELAEQLTSRGVGALDAIFVAAGSGSTAAGILAGVLRSGIARRVVAVQVAPNPALRALIVGQASHALWKRGGAAPPIYRALRALRIDGRFVGGGYGFSSEHGERASTLARSFGLGLEPTYTAKAFAAALEWSGALGTINRRKLRLRRRQTYLYWHTLSSVPLAALLQGAPETLPNELAQLLRRPYP